jgi:hypothetical protein
VDGYLFASLEADGSLYCEETLASSTLAYAELVSRLPQGTVVKLPPDVPLAGTLRTWGVVIPVDVSSLLRAFCGDAAALRLRVFDEFLPWNCGMFDGAGNQTSEPAWNHLSAGRLMQFFCGYLPYRNVFSAETCYCADEY